MKQLTNNNRGKEQVLNISAVIILILTISSLSFAQGFYGTAQFGYSMQVSDSQPIGTNIAVDSDFPAEFAADGSILGGIGIGYMFNDNFRVEGRFGYRNNNINDTQFGTGERDGHEYILNGEIKNTTLTLIGFYDIVNNSSFTPYVKVGLGVASNNYSARLGGAGVALYDPYDGKTDGYYDAYEDGESTELSWNIGVGASYELSKRVSIYGEYQYARFGSVSTGQDAFTDGFDVENAAANEIVIGTRINLTK